MGDRTQRHIWFSRYLILLANLLLIGELNRMGYAHKQEIITSHLQEE